MTRFFNAMIELAAPAMTRADIGLPHAINCVCSECTAKLYPLHTGGEMTWQDLWPCCEAAWPMDDRSCSQCGNDIDSWMGSARPRTDAPYAFWLGAAG